MKITVIPVQNTESSIGNKQYQNFKIAKVFDYIEGVGTINFSVLKEGTVIVHQFGFFTNPDAQSKILRILKQKYSYCK